jgi:hypothetical protein
MEVTLLLPRDLGNKILLHQARRSVRALSQSLVNLVYLLVARPFPRLLIAKTSFLLSFSLNSRVEACSLLFWKLFSLLCFVDIMVASGGMNLYFDL